MQALDDERWAEQLNASPAQFFRAKSDMVSFALPLLNSPPELLDYLEKDWTEPEYDDYEWISTEASKSAATVLDTGLTGYELMSCIVKSADGTDVFPYNGAIYDKETGNITMPQQAEAGISYEFDFYTDGTMAELTKSQLRLFGLAVSVVWDEHFTSSWLNRQPKIHDSSFSVVNEAQYTEKSSKEFNERMQRFQDELKKYEQLCAYKTITTRSLNTVLA